MRCIAIDDEPKALAVVAHYAAKVPSIELLQTFRSSIDALHFLSNQPVDLIFLDINMPDLTGIEFLKALPHPPLIVFTTAYSEYAVESYEWEAVGYLLKPIDFQKFIKAVNKAETLLKLKSRPPTSPTAEEFILVKSGVQTYQLKLKDILYLEAAGNYVTFVTREKKVVTLNSLCETQKLLPAAKFVRVHKSFVVARAHIEVIESCQLKVAGTELPIGRTYREALQGMLK